MSAAATSVELLNSGVLIRLRPIITNLIMTLILVIAELSCVSSMLVLLGLWECRALEKGAGVSITNHSRRVKGIEIMALALFIAIELVTSILTKDFLDRNLQPHECFSARARHTSVQSTNEQLDFARQRLTFSCLKLSSFSAVTVHSGNFSLDTKETICDEDWTFRYDSTKITTLLIPSDATKECVHGNQNGEPYTTCVAVFLRTSEQGIRSVYMSYPISEGNITNPHVAASGGPVKFVSTEFNYNPERFLPLFAKELVEGYDIRRFDDLEVRSRLFLGIEKTECPHGPLVTLTLIPYAIVAMTACIWGISLGLFVVTRFLKRFLFFSMQRPLHWAIKLDNNLSTHGEGKRTHVYSDVVDGVRRVYLRDKQCARELE
eukprot:TRINITY_DN8823_c0_g2_i1.p1 TRINITY_DN8823_c0_g2~~TRINITY_DN8823_c0_g2_i1.p1  ORF type:complete len:377 (-),score=43.91 TRINITY_DN8823_c0_g2_i1:302-1432(-)